MKGSKCYFKFCEEFTTDEFRHFLIVPIKYFDKHSKFKEGWMGSHLRRIGIWDNGVSGVFSTRLTRQEAELKLRSNGHIEKEFSLSIISNVVSDQLAHREELAEMRKRDLEWQKSVGLR